MIYYTPVQNEKFLFSSIEINGECPEGYVELTDKQVEGLNNHTMCWVGDNVVPYGGKDNSLKIQELQDELNEIKQWFYSTDWIPNKITVKEWNETDYRWLTYLEQRKEKRSRQDQIESALRELEK